MHVPVVVTLADLQRGCTAYRENEPRDSIYMVAYSLMQQWWGDVPRVVDALTVLLLVWNARYYQWNNFYLDAEHLEQCLRANWQAIEDFHDRDIMSFAPADGPSIQNLFDSLRQALQINVGDSVRTSPIGVAKTLHLLAPSFFPLWDTEIASAYGCDHLRGAAEYLRFFGEIRRIAAELQGVPKVPGRTLVKQIDEYNFARFTKHWI